MFDEMLTPARNVISLADARKQRRPGTAQPLRARICCHCGAALGDNDNEDECSSAGFSAVAVTGLRKAE